MSDFDESLGIAKTKTISPEDPEWLRKRAYAVVAELLSCHLRDSTGLPPRLVPELQRIAKSFTEASRIPPTETK